MSKTNQRRVSMYAQGKIDFHKYTRPVWKSHPFKSDYMRGWNSAKIEYDRKRKAEATRRFFLKLREPFNKIVRVIKLFCGY